MTRSTERLFENAALASETRGDVTLKTYSFGSAEVDTSAIQQAIHANAKDKGWWPDNAPPSFGEICALLHSEITEAFEEYRAGRELAEIYERDGKPEGIPVEIADLVIRAFDFCEWIGIDLGAVIAHKHAYNKTRAFKHGGKVI